MRLQTFLKFGGALLLTGVLAACGSSNTPAPQSTATSHSLESNFGSEFAAIFDAPSTAQPATLDNSSVPALQPAGQPVAFSTSSS